jgi:RimJ/RimL family protein N-acetyltransferase
MLRIDPRNVLPHRIETPRLVLRAPMRADVPQIVKLADNRRVAAMLSALPSPYTRADGVAFVEIYSQRWDERPYVVTLDGAMIGVTGFSFEKNKPPQLGYWLGEPHWGKGYATEAARALIETAEATGQYDRMVSGALSSNSGSINVLKKVGFTFTHEASDLEGGFARKAVSYFLRERAR